MDTTKYRDEEATPEGAADGSQEFRSDLPDDIRPCFILAPHIFNSLSAPPEVEGTDTEDESSDIFNWKTRRGVMVQQNFDLGAALMEFKKRGAKPLPELVDQKYRTGGCCRVVYDLQNDKAEGLPGYPDLVRYENDPEFEKNDSVNQCYTNFGIVYNFFLKVFGRNSLDGNGVPLVATVNFEMNYPNAMWCPGTQQMIFGNGFAYNYWTGERYTDFESYFGDFTANLETIAHELTHGFISHTVNFFAGGEPGALNESMADVFGSMVLQWHLGQLAKDASWVMGASLLPPDLKDPNIKGLRSLEDPGTAFDGPIIGKDPQVAHYNKFSRTGRTSYDDHVNSGIPNKAFCWIAKELGGNSWDVAGKIWYNTLTTKRTGNPSQYKVSRGARIQDFANATWDEAKKTFGDEIAKAVYDGWDKVGIRIEIPKPRVVKTQ